jgi:hypothetical protein
MKKLIKAKNGILVILIVSSGRPGLINSQLSVIEIQNPQ